MVGRAELADVLGQLANRSSIRRVRRGQLLLQSVSVGDVQGKQDLELPEKKHGVRSVVALSPKPFDALVLICDVLTFPCDVPLSFCQVILDDCSVHVHGYVPRVT